MTNNLLFNAKALNELGFVRSLEVTSNDPVLKYSFQQIEDEFKLICQKKSKLSANQRHFVTRTFFQRAGIKLGMKVVKECQELIGTEPQENKK